MEIRNILETVQSQNNTHIAIKQNGKIRYLIDDSHSGRTAFLRTFRGYSVGNMILRFMIRFVPTSILNFVSFVDKAEAKIKGNIFEEINQLCSVENMKFNVIYGTYNKTQKIVIQFFCGSKIVYAKIGDKYSAALMENEASFLFGENTYSTFRMPEILGFKRADEYQIMLTAHFDGTKKAANISPQVMQCYSELSSISKSICETEEMLFASHGDFTPWNMSIANDNKLLVYDWEYFDYRFYGFDLIHYLYTVNLFIKKYSIKDALDSAVIHAKQLDPKLANFEESRLKDNYVMELKKRGWKNI